MLSLKVIWTLFRQIGSGFSRFVHKEFTAIWPAFLFFDWIPAAELTHQGGARGILDPDCSFPNAVVGALIVAKAALALDETPLARALETYPALSLRREDFSTGTYSLFFQMIIGGNHFRRERC